MRIQQIFFLTLVLSVNWTSCQPSDSYNSTSGADAGRNSSWVTDPTNSQASSNSTTVNMIIATATTTHASSSPPSEAINTTTEVSVVASLSSNDSDANLTTSAVVSTSTAFTAADSTSATMISANADPSPSTTASSTMISTTAAQFICGRQDLTFPEGNPCSTVNHLVYSPRSIPTPGECDDNMSLPLAAWFRLEGSEGCETFDVMPNLDPPICYQSGVYGVQYPFYLSSGTMPAPGQNETLSFCATEYTGSGRNLCCHYNKTMEVTNCDGFYIYKLMEHLDSSICGHYFSSPDDGSVEDDLDFRQIVTDEDVVKKATSLSEEHKSAITTIRFKVTDWNEFKRNQGLEADLYYSLGNQLEDYYSYLESQTGSLRTRRANGDTFDVYPLYGSPTYDLVKNEAVYELLVVRMPKNEAVSPEDIHTVLCGVKLDGLSASVATLITRENEPIPTPQPEDNLWIAIIIIIAVVGFIIIVTLLVLCCCILSRRRRSGRMEVTHPKMLLVDDRSITPVEGVDNFALDEEPDKKHNGEAIVNGSVEQEVGQKTAEETV